MTSSEETVPSLIVRDKRSARLLLAVVLFGLAVIGAWQWFATPALPLAAVVAVTAGLAAAYGGALAAVGATLVWRADRSRESAVVELYRRTEVGKRLAIYDQASGLFHHWYLELRLDGEIRRCQRYDLPLAVIAVKVEYPDGELSPAAQEQLNADLALHVARTVRDVDIPAGLGELEYAVFLPQSDRAGAEATAARLRDALGEYSTATGIALYPEDGCEGRLLLEHARRLAQSAPWARSA